MKPVISFSRSPRVRSWSTCNQNFARRLFSSSPRPIDTLDNLARRTDAGRPLVFHSSSQCPYHNLAIEHYLLTKSPPTSHILLFYTNQPCVVIGRNQNPWSECNLGQMIEGLDGTPVDLVRRRSGGGAVFHDIGNLNFSVIVPNDEHFNRRKHAEMVVRALKRVEPTLKSWKAYQDIWVNQRHDISISRESAGTRAEFKVSGSAFKLTRGRALHHGTLLHSSPNLLRISNLLRSPGRDRIQAKGVESVRSPVSNIYHVGDEMRDLVRATIVKGIAAEFSQLYGTIEEVNVGDDATRVTGIATGVDEIITDQWRFEQTPRFEFESASVDGHKVTMSVNRAIIEECSIAQLRAQNLLTVKDWTGLTVAELATYLGSVFPPVGSLARVTRSSSNVKER